ncbi:MAG TPA: PKD domain-containing protein, partial [Pseudomonadales bacterium]|nr:PKD domain-containing protein [Pseudomonadales bacterium]
KTLSYGGGPWYQTTHNNGDTFILSDADASQIPAGAQMVLDNTTNDGGYNGIYTIYLNSAKTRSQMTTNGQINVFNWIKGIGWVNANVVQSNAVQSATVGFTMTPTNGIVPATAQFQSPITDSTGSTITSWNWNFGDGTTGTGQSPTHVYTTVGTFSPSLVFTNSNGTAGRSSGAAIIVNQVKLGQVFSAGTMTLAWPTNAVGYALQYTTNLSPPVVWRPFLSTPAIVNGQYIATSLTSGPQMFFRLATKISALISSPSQPKLALIIAGEKLVLSWPASAVGFILQSTTNLSPPVNWSTVPATPVSVGGQDVVTNSISGPQMFFRLMN